MARKTRSVEVSNVVSFPLLSFLFAVISGIAALCYLIFKLFNKNK